MSFSLGDQWPVCSLCQCPIKPGDIHQQWEPTEKDEVMAGRLVCRVVLPTDDPGRVRIIQSEGAPG